MRCVAMLAIAAVVLACALQAEAQWGGGVPKPRRIGRPLNGRLRPLLNGRLRPLPPMSPVIYPAPYPVNPAGEDVDSDALGLFISFLLKDHPLGLVFDLLRVYGIL
ncbi:hypothetical protein DPMN_173389 [Dreissena polymorpha]|uniref:Uncharacterized protein n=1 Tax=Dreissena polymorpha TaxID=45954 RepID=A0A9D4IGW5_DREPO|nr:hypothetical protein DPMN_173389 [Dreissena polymorpha]